ncbi:MAG: hypothetical protein II702_00800 [Clostridia bacterium]|nr:hypothetical protein [Clostridia bacterium]
MSAQLLFSKIKDLLGNKNSLPVYDCGDGARLLVFTDADIDDYKTVSDYFIENGFAVYDKTSIKDCSFITLNNDEATVQLSFCGECGGLRIVFDPGTALCPKEDNRAGNIRTELYQFEVDHTFIDCGMCYIMRLCDGSFFVVDSAHFLSVNDHKRLYDFMRGLTQPGKKVHIAGWFITHAHDDHVCQLLEYLKHDMDNSVIERIYMNIIPDNHRDSHSWGESVKDITEHFKKEVYSLKNIPVVKLHTGQRFAVRNIEFTVLCTHEDVYPLSCEDYNESSTVLMCRAEGQKILFTGDACKNESEILEKRYGVELKSDIVQVAHHAHFGMTGNAYRLISAKVALFPTTYIFFEQDIEKYEASKTALNLSDEHYVASDGTVGLPLPFSAGQAELFPDETFENFDAIKALWGYSYTDEYKEFLRQRFEKNHNR